MNEDIYHAENLDSSSQVNRKSSLGKTFRTIHFTQSLEVVKERIKVAFTGTIVESDGFFSPNFSYTAQIDDNLISLDYSKSGRYGGCFEGNGYLQEDAAGSILEITIKTPGSAYILPAIYSLLLWLFLAQKSLQWPVVIVIPVALIALEWQRLVAADRITSLITRIVAGEAV